MINNFDIIKKILEFPSKNEFYFLQVLQRSKDHPSLGSNSRLLKTYSIYSLEYLDKVSIEILQLSHMFNARVYIHPTRRNNEIIAFKMVEAAVKRIQDNQLESIHNLYDSICGRFPVKERYWVIDVDFPEGKYNSSVASSDLIKAISECRPLGPKILIQVPTKSGYHLITSPFDLKHFDSYKFTNISIQKNNPTLMYCP